MPQGTLASTPAVFAGPHGLLQHQDHDFLLPGTERWIRTLYTTTVCIMNTEFQSMAITSNQSDTTF